MVLGCLLFLQLAKCLFLQKKLFIPPKCTFFRSEEVQFKNREYFILKMSLNILTHLETISLMKKMISRQQAQSTFLGSLQ